MGVPDRVRLQNRQRRLKLESDRLRALVTAVLEGEGADPRAEVELVFLRDTPMSALNQAWRGQIGPTDVLSFPAGSEAWPAGEPRLLGSVVISVDRALAQAAERGEHVERELDRLMVHGLLHLLGHDHHERAERARMRRREDRYLPARGR